MNPELIVIDIPAPVYTKPHEPIDYSKVKGLGPEGFTYNIYVDGKLVSYK